MVAPPTIAKEFGAASIAVNGTTTLTFTLINPNVGTALSGVAFTDSFPAGLEVAATPRRHHHRLRRADLRTDGRRHR